MKLLNVTDGIDCEVTAEEMIELQKKDDSLRKYWEEAEKGNSENREEIRTRFEVKKGLLYRKKEEQGRPISQLMRESDEVST